MKPKSLTSMPARRSPVRLSELRPVVAIDTREQTPLSFQRLPSKVVTLQSGDYSFIGGENLLAIERKTIADLVACCMGQNRERFFRELHRLRGFPFRRLLIIGSRREIETGQYRSAIAPRSVLATLSAIEARFDVPIVYTANSEAAAWQVEEWVWWYAREIILNTNNLIPSRKQ